MLKSAGSEGRGVTAKVADFGLSMRMDSTETHMSNCFVVSHGRRVRLPLACTVQPPPDAAAACPCHPLRPSPSPSLPRAP
jgi:hypothetical protein